MDLGPGKGVAVSKQGFTDPLVSVCFLDLIQILLFILGGFN